MISIKFTSYFFKKYFKKKKILSLYHIMQHKKGEVKLYMQNFLGKIVEENIKG